MLYYAVAYRYPAYWDQYRHLHACMYMYLPYLANGSQNQIISSDPWQLPSRLPKIWFVLLGGWEGIVGGKGSGCSGLRIRHWHMHQGF